MVFRAFLIVGLLLGAGTPSSAQRLDSLGTGVELYSGQVILGKDIRFKKPFAGIWKVLVDSASFVARDVRYVRADTLMWANIAHLRKLTGVSRWALRVRKDELSEYELWRMQVGFETFFSFAYAYPRRERFYTKNEAPLVRNLRSQLWPYLQDHPRSLRSLKASRRYAWIGSVGMIGGAVAAGIGASKYTPERMHQSRPPFAMVAGAISLWTGGVSFLIARSKLRQAVRRYWTPRPAQ